MVRTTGIDGRVLPIAGIVVLSAALLPVAGAARTIAPDRTAPTPPTGEANETDWAGEPLSILREGFDALLAWIPDRPDPHTFTGRVRAVSAGGQCGNITYSARAYVLETPEGTYQIVGVGTDEFADSIEDGDRITVEGDVELAVTDGCTQPITRRVIDVEDYRIEGEPNGTQASHSSGLVS